MNRVEEKVVIYITIMMHYSRLFSPVVFKNVLILLALGYILIFTKLIAGILLLLVFCPVISYVPVQKLLHQLIQDHT